MTRGAEPRPLRQMFVGRCRFVSVVAVVAATLVAACRPPALTPLSGGVVPAGAAVLPAFPMATGQRRVLFKWEMNDGGMVFRGDGVVRSAYPDSARVDLFMGGMFGGGASVTMIGDSARTPPGARMTDLIPSPPLLWAALGRLAVPALPDTTISIQGDTLRADIGKPVQWRVTAITGMLRRVERVHGNRVVEYVQRDAAGKRIMYELALQRSLELIVGDDQPAAFDASIWRY